MTRAAYEARLAALSGRRVEGVTYYDVVGSDPATGEWDRGDWHHAVMGVGLATDRGPVSLLWTSAFGHWGVEAFETPMSEHLCLDEDGPVGWDVGDHSQWRTRLGSPIRAVTVRWERDLPYAVRLDLDGGPVWVAAAMPDWPDPGAMYVGGDELVVAFSDTVLS